MSDPLRIGLPYVYVKLLGLLFSVLLPHFGLSQPRVETSRNLGSMRGVSQSIILSRISESLIDSDPDSALWYQQKALAIARKEKNIPNITHSLNIIGEIYLSMQDYTTAMDYLQQALRYGEQTQNRLEIGTTLNDIASVYADWGQDEKALEYYLKMLEYIDPTNPIEDQIVSYNNVAVQYVRLKNFKKGLLFYKKAMDLAVSAKDTSNIALIHSNMGTMFSDQNLRNQAVVNYQRSFDLYLHTKEFDGTTVTAYNLSKEWIALGNYAKALVYADTIKRFRFKEDHDFLRYSLMCEIYDSLHNFKDAFHYSKLANRIKDSIFRKEKFEILSRHFAANENAANLTRIAQLTEQTTRLSVLDFRYRWLFFLSLGIALFSVAWLFIALGSKRKLFVSLQRAEQRASEKQQQVQSLAENGRIVELKLGQLQVQYENLQDNLELRKNHSIMLVHDLKNPLSSILSIVETPPTKLSDALENSTLIQHAANQMLELVHSILNNESFEQGKYNLIDENFTLNKLISETLKQHSYGIKQNNIEVETYLEDAVKVKADQLILARVLNNLIGNALKYAPVSSKLSIKCYAYDAQFAQIEIIDRGPGIKKERIEQIFDKFVQFGEKHIAKQESTGLGLTFCKLATEAMGGKIGVTSDYGKGARFWIQIPLSQK